jgi:hypothetical protein
MFSRDKKKGNTIEKNSQLLVVVVEADRVDAAHFDAAPAVATTLLLGLFMPERLALQYMCV